MNFNDLQTWHWFAIIGGGVLVLGLVLYFLPLGKVKIPGAITAAFGALGAGLAAGIIFMAGFGYKPFTPTGDTPSGDAEAKGEPKTPGPKGKTGGGPPPKGKTGGFAPPTAKAQLANLVTALDTVVDRPVTVNLLPEDRAAIAKELDGLDAASELKEEDAKAKLEAIQKILEKDRKTLETVGYRWAGDAKGGFPKGGGPKEPPPNPFKEGTSAERLKSLMERLNKK
jgi:hypothetical protein